MELEEAIEKLENYIGSNDIIAADYLIMLCLAKEIRKIKSELEKK